MHHAQVIQIRGDSYRLRHPRQSGLLGGKLTALRQAPDKAGESRILSATWVENFVH